MAIRSSEVYESELTEKLFLNNEEETNRLITSTMTIFGAMLIAITILDFFKLYFIGSDVCQFLMFLSGCMCLALKPIGRHFGYDMPQLKWLILQIVTFASGVIFFFFPLNASFLTYGPIVISALYYDQELVRRTSWRTWAAYSILLWGNVVLQACSPNMQRFHAWVEVSLWQYPDEVLMNHFIPHSIFFLVTAIVCNRIAKKEKTLVREQVRMTSEVNSIEADLNAASEIQLGSLPQQNFQTPDGEAVIGSFIRPAKVVGGDFFDYFIFDSSLIFMIGDVSDKGLPAALYMMWARSTIRSAVLSEGSIDEAIKTINEALSFENPTNMFVTLILGAVNLHSGVGKYVNCGHPEPVLKHADGSISVLKTEPDLMAGVFPEAAYAVHPLRLTPGDSLFLFTDGMTDAFDLQNDSFGDERLQEVIRDLPANCADACESIVAGVDRFANGADQFDDMTILCLRMLKTEDPVTTTLHCAADFDAVEPALDSVNELLRKVNCPDDVRRVISVALDEVFANIIDYAYPEGSGEFSVQLAAGKNYADITILDSGVPFNPLEADEPLFPDDPEIGGLGIHLVKNIMNDMDYTRDGAENRLHLLKIWGM